jgi:hypothetical protein
MDRLFNSVAMARADIPAASISVSKGRSASARAIASWRYWRVSSHIQWS